MVTGSFHPIVSTVRPKMAEFLLLPISSYGEWQPHPRDCNRTIKIFPAGSLDYKFKKTRDSMLVLRHEHKRISDFVPRGPFFAPLQTVSIARQDHFPLWFSGDHLRAISIRFIGDLVVGAWVSASNSSSGAVACARRVKNSCQKYTFSR